MQLGLEEEVQGTIKYLICVPRKVAIIPMGLRKQKDTVKIRKRKYR